MLYKVQILGKSQITLRLEQFVQKGPMRPGDMVHVRAMF